MKKIVCLFFVCSVVFLTGCSSTKYMTGGAKDNGPLVFGDEYKLSQLKEVSLEGSAFWGIPKTNKLTKDAKNKTGLIFNFNGVNISSNTKLLPILSLIGYTAASGYGLNLLFGTKQVQQGGSYSGNVFYPDYVTKSNLPLAPAFLIAIPIAGTLNNLTFSNSALGSAGSKLNYKLITDNPEIDVFFYPKYTITNKVNFWTQKSTVKANVKGAKLKMK